MRVPHEERLKRLMVIVADRVSDLARKGELIDCYYNPGNLFREVLFVLLNDDRPPVDVVQRQVGDARVSIHNHPAGMGTLVRTVGWRKALLRRWARPIVELARESRPQLVRTYNPRLAGFAAREVRRELGIPYAVSLHVNPDSDIRNRAAWHDRVMARIADPVDRLVLRDADVVLPVYESILPYARRLGATNVNVHYNVINPEHLTAKSSYVLNDPPRLISVGRQFREKDPSNIIRALGLLPGVTLAIVGDGPYHTQLEEIASSAGVADRVTFIHSLPNDELCRRLPGYDIFVVHNDYWGVPKTVLEALLSGLPSVINLRRPEPVPELTSDICELVENSPQAYAAAIASLLMNDGRREALGRRAAARAADLWSPKVTESRYVETLRRFAR